MGVPSLVKRCYCNGYPRIWPRVLQFSRWQQAADVIEPSVFFPEHCTARLLGHCCLLGRVGIKRTCRISSGMPWMGKDRFSDRASLWAGRWDHRGSNLIRPDPRNSVTSTVSVLLQL